MGKAGQVIRSIFSHTLLIVNVIALIWLICCYLSSVVDPAKVRYLALFSLTTPFAIAANFFFAFCWFFSSRKSRILFSIITLVLFYKMIPAVFGLHYFSKNDWTKNEHHIKLMTWNVHGMGIYNRVQHNTDRKNMLQFIKDESPDILCMPEYAPYEDPNKKDVTNDIVKANQYKEFRFVMEGMTRYRVAVGIGFFSKYPIRSYREYELDKLVTIMQCDLETAPGKLLSVFVIHLKSFGLSDRDKKYIERVKHRETDNLAHSRSFVWKFNQAYKVRSREAEQIDSIVKTCPNPVMICGDFNDLPCSYTYNTIKGNLYDAFSEKAVDWGVPIIISSLR